MPGLQIAMCGSPEFPPDLKGGQFWQHKKVLARIERDAGRLTMVMTEA